MAAGIDLGNGDIVILGYDKETGILITNIEKYMWDGKQHTSGMALLDTNMFSVPTKITSTKTTNLNSEATNQFFTVETKTQYTGYLPEWAKSLSDSEIGEECRKFSGTGSEDADWCHRWGVYSMPLIASTFNISLSEKYILTLSPKKQTHYGILSENVVCKEGLELIFKNNDSPACVKHNTAEKLIERNWGHYKN